MQIQALDSNDNPIGHPVTATVADECKGCSNNNFGEWRNTTSSAYFHSFDFLWQIYLLGCGMNWVPLLRRSMSAFLSCLSRSGALSQKSFESAQRGQQEE
jgi:hypothetical protein